MLTHWIWLAQKKKISDHSKQQLIQHISDPEELYCADRAFLSALPDMTENIQEELMDKDLTLAESILKQCNRKQIRLICYHDDGYPQRLRDIYDPPMVLYCIGKVPPWDELPVVGIVGTRDASTYGINTAKRFGQQIAVCGAAVVPGGAAGIDSAAMEGALAGNGPVVCVMGCGVDVVYPAKNRGLFDKVTQTGCLISELPPGERPKPWYFLYRNRIITGISNALLVVEAPEKSGALNSARHGMEQGREVYVVPGNVDSHTCAGSNQLLQEGAIPALSGWDVLSGYASVYPGKIQKRDIPAALVKPEPELKQPTQIPEPVSPGKRASDKKSIDKEEKSTYSVVNNPTAALNQEEQQVLARIPREPVSTDAVIAGLDLTSGAVRSILTKLTLKGLVQNHPGGRISRK